MNKEVKIILSISIIAILAVILFVIFGSKPNSSGVDKSKLLDNAIHMTGKKDAKVTIVEFGDYQCPACGQMYPVLKQVVDTYGENPNFNFVLRNFPLPQHTNALISAEAAEAAGAQGKFWEMEGLLYENQSEWSDSSAPIDIFVKYASQLKLDTTKFKNEILSNKYSDIINKDLADGNAIDISWTPSIYINGELQQGMLTYDQFKSKIDGLLNN